MTYSNSFNPAYSSVLGLLPFLKSGQTNPASVYVESPIPEADSAELRLSPTKIINKADGTKLGQKYEPLFDTYPDPETFLKRTKSLSSKALNANLQLKISGNPKFSDFLNVGMKGFEIPYYSFDTPYATNAFSDYINAVTLGSYVTGAPNFFAEAEFWNSVPLIEGFDGNAYDKDLISKPFHEVGYPKGLPSDEFTELIKSKTDPNYSGNATASGSLDLDKLRSAINASNGESITVSKDLLNALVNSAESGTTSIDAQTSALEKSLYGSNGIKNAMSDGGAGLYNSVKSLSDIDNLSALASSSSASNAASATSLTGGSAQSSKLGNKLSGYGFTSEQASMVSNTMSWAKSLTANPSAASTPASSTTTPSGTPTATDTSALAANLPGLQQLASTLGSPTAGLPTAAAPYMGTPAIGAAAYPSYTSPIASYPPAAYPTGQQGTLMQLSSVMQQFLGGFQQLARSLGY